MLNKNNNFIFKFFFFLLITIFFSKQGFPASLTKDINEIVKSAEKNSFVGIMIADAKSGKILYQSNPEHFFIPASNMKLFTAYAALKKLGPSYKFTTTIYVDTTQIKNGILSGNVYIKFSGDPSFTGEQFNHLIEALLQKGVKEVNGKFIVIGAPFDEKVFGPGWMWDDENYCDGVALNNLVIDHNCINVDIFPSQKIKQYANYRVERTIIPVKINNFVTTEEPAVKCSIRIAGNGYNDYVLTGCVNQQIEKNQDLSKKNISNKTNSDKKNQVKLAINNSSYLIKYYLEQSLSLYHIRFNGPIIFAGNMPQLKPIFENQSETLSNLMKYMLKESDNLYAGSLFKKIGQVSSGQLGSWRTGEIGIKSTISNLTQIKANSWKDVDGSGLSRYNLVTPRQILSLLTHVYNDSTIHDVFIQALPISGIDGTLKDRMTSPQLIGRVFAKTGTMTGVSALSGYIQTKSKKTLVFVILINNFLDPPEKSQTIQADIANRLVNYH